MNPVLIDPGVVTLIQSTFLDNINAAFTTASAYAFNLLYLFAVLELALSGLAWALQRDTDWGKIFFKIIKIGLIFFIIQNYAWLLNTIVSSFAKLAGTIVNNDSVAQYVFNPAKIWQYGYDVGIYYLHLAASSSANASLGLTMIQICLGMGILLVFGLLGIQMIVQMVGFYLVSFGALIFVPFGAFSASHNMLDKALQSVFQAGLRLMTLIIVIGIAVTVWDGFQLADLATNNNFNISQPLGLFFTALLFLCLAIYLPKVVSQTVGELKSNFSSESNTQAVATVRESIVTTVDAGSGISNMQAATTISLDTSGGGSRSEGSSTAAAATISSTGAGASIGGGTEIRGSGESLGQASAVNKSFSENTVKKIKDAVMQAMKEKPAKS